MAAPPQPPSSQPSKSRPKRKRIQKEGKSKRLNSLPWSSAFSTDDPISLVVGSKELEGGFFSLEEIDEADYGFELPKPEGGNKQLKSLKQKHSNVDGSDGTEGEECNDGVEGEVEGETQLVTKKKGKKEKKEKEKEKESTNNVNEGATDGVELQSEDEQDEDDKLKKKKRKKENKDSAGQYCDLKPSCVYNFVAV